MLLFIIFCFVSRISLEIKLFSLSSFTPFSSLFSSPSSHPPHKVNPMNQGSNAMLAPPGAISASGKSENNNMIADRRGSSRMTVVPEDKACCYDNPVSNKGKLFQVGYLLNDFN